MGKKKAETLNINGTKDNPTGVGKILGLTITKTKFSAHSTSWIAAAKPMLPLIYSFCSLTSHHKRKLQDTYFYLVKSALKYIPTPMHLLSNTMNMKPKMQNLQVRAARIISCVRYMKIINNEDVNSITELEPTNISVHEQATNHFQENIGR